MLWLMTTCTVGMSRPLEAEGSQHHCPHGETEAGTHPRSLSSEAGAPKPLPETRLPFWPLCGGVTEPASVREYPGLLTGTPHLLQSGSGKYWT